VGTGRDASDSGEEGSFREAVGEVKPLEDSEKLARPAPRALRRRRRRDPGDSVVFEVDRLGERIEGRPSDSDPGILRKLRNAEFATDARLDLHGLDLATARRRVRETLLTLREEGGRCALVVHGRGRHSEAGPVLKEALLDWLAEPPVGPLVLAFATASPGDGGVGATYVLLRRER
jgi:DNA-nicking Smr family endonuclease